MKIKFTIIVVIMIKYYQIIMKILGMMIKKILKIYRIKIYKNKYSKRNKKELTIIIKII